MQALYPCPNLIYYCLPFCGILWECAESSGVRAPVVREPGPAAGTGARGAVLTPLLHRGGPAARPGPGAAGADAQRGQRLVVRVHSKGEMVDPSADIHAPAVGRERELMRFLTDPRMR